MPDHPGASDTVPINLTINRETRRLHVAPWTSLLDLLREGLDLTGSKKGCDHGQCGACPNIVAAIQQVLEGAR